jgi:hypothetical protein
MSNVEWKVVTPPNEEHRGDRRANSYLPLAGMHVAIEPCNQGQLGDSMRDTSLLIPNRSPVHEHGHRFDVESVRLPEAHCANAPGHGAIPVETVTATTRVLRDDDFLKLPPS